MVTESLKRPTSWLNCVYSLELTAERGGKLHQLITGRTRRFILYKRFLSVNAIFGGACHAVTQAYVA